VLLACTRRDVKKSFRTKKSSSPAIKNRNVDCSAKEGTNVITEFIYRDASNIKVPYFKRSTSKIHTPSRETNYAVKLCDLGISELQNHQTLCTAFNGCQITSVFSALLEPLDMDNVQDISLFPSMVTLKPDNIPDDGNVKSAFAGLNEGCNQPPPPAEPPPTRTFAMHLLKQRDIGAIGFAALPWKSYRGRTIDHVLLSWETRN
jgi:hypothetical protein